RAGAGQPLEDLGRAFLRHRFAADLLRQASAVDELEREEGKAVALADLEDLDDVGMLEAGDRLALDAESFELVLAGMLAGDHHLEGDDPVEPGLPRLVNHAHPAPAELAQDLISIDQRRAGRAACLLPLPRRLRRRP